MQVGLTRADLLSIIAKYAEELSDAIRRGPSMVAETGVTDVTVDQMVSRMSALTSHLFAPPPTLDGKPRVSKRRGKKK
jgi:hypothetical protein